MRFESHLFSIFLYLFISCRKTSHIYTVAKDGICRNRYHVTAIHLVVWPTIRPRREYKANIRYSPYCHFEPPILASQMSSDFKTTGTSKLKFVASQGYSCFIVACVMCKTAYHTYINKVTD